MPQTRIVAKNAVFGIRCPHCGLPYQPAQQFEAVAPTFTPPQAPTPKLQYISEIRQSVAVSLTTASGALFVLWGTVGDYYWLAPVAGVVAPLGLAAWQLWLARPEQPTRVKLRVDVSEHGKRRRMTIDVFEGVRPTQLWRFADGAINRDIPISRRKMAGAGVTETQYGRIRAVLVERGWVEVAGELDNSAAALNRSGRAVLRAFLSEFPTPPDRDTKYSKFSLVRGASTTPPPPHHPQEG